MALSIRADVIQLFYQSVTRYHVPTILSKYNEITQRYARYIFVLISKFYISLQDFVGRNIYFYYMTNGNNMLLSHERRVRNISHLQHVIHYWQK